ncbi:hypothetical protein FRC02_005985 [Tulasnella sp. 418]|nr:hypothetical protein FRC02_005985 [Tulasnella sp. 418]
MLATLFATGESITLFAGYAPRLRRLRLLPCSPLIWEPKGLAGLINLRISASQTIHPGATSQFFLLMQSSSPNLETLIIGPMVKRYRSRHFQWVPSVVTFPKLKNLTLSGTPSELIGFISPFL